MPFDGEIRTDDRPQPCQIHLEKIGLRAVGNVAVRIRYEDMIVDIEGDTLVCRSTKAQLGFACGQPGFANALVEKMGRHAEEHVVDFAKQRRHKNKARRWLHVFLGVFVLMIAGVLLAPYLAEASVAFLPISADEELGQTAQKEIKLGPEVTDPRIVEPLEQIVARLLPGAKRTDFDFRLTVVNNAMLNAFALPGGQMYITTGLLKASNAPEEIAGVMAHEIAHVTLRHSMRRFMKQQSMLTLASMVGGEGSAMSIAAQGAAVAMVLGYSREQELAADAEGLRNMEEVGLDGTALKDIFMIMRDRQPKIAAEIPDWISTHPNMDERMRRIDAAVGVPVPRDGMGINWAALKGALPVPPPPPPKFF